MGRSVSYASNAIKVLYFAPNLEAFIQDEDGNDTQERDFDIENENFWEFVDQVEETFFEHFKGFETVRKEWESNEVQTILKSNQYKVHVSEYCGLISVSVTINEPYSLEDIKTDKIRTAYEEYLVKAFESKIPAILEDLKYYEPLTKIGSFSNGEGVFEKVSK